MVPETLLIPRFNTNGTHFSKAILLISFILQKQMFDGNFDESLIIPNRKEVQLIILSSCSSNIFFDIWSGRTCLLFFPLQFWEHTEDFGIHIFTKCKQGKNAEKSSHTCGPAEPGNKLCWCLRICSGQHWMLSFSSSVKKSTHRLSPRKENKQKLETLAAVKHITEHHRKDDRYRNCWSKTVFCTPFIC